MYLDASPAPGEDALAPDKALGVRSWVVWLAKGLGRLTRTCPSSWKSAAPLPDPAQQTARYVARLSYYSNSAKLASVLSKMAGQRMLLLLLASGNLAQGAKDLSTKGV